MHGYNSEYIKYNRKINYNIKLYRKIDIWFFITSINFVSNMKNNCKLNKTRIID